MIVVDFLCIHHLKLYKEIVVSLSKQIEDSNELWLYFDRIYWGRFQF